MSTDAEPWGAGDAFRLVASSTAAVVVIVAGWVIASGTDTFSRQVLGVGIGSASLLVGGCGFTRWLVAGLRQVRRARRTVIDHLDRTVPRAVAVTVAVDDPTTVLVAGARMTRAHRKDCRLAVGKSVRPVTDRDIAARQLTRCGICS
jgi:hypothetical protein